MRWFFFRATSIALIVFRIIWIIFAAALWVVGLVGFVNAAEIGNWFVWGVICAVPMCVQVIRQALSSARDGAARGSREYTVTAYFDGTAYVSDNSSSGCLWGFVGGLLGGIVIGPLVLPLYVVGVCVTVILDIIAFIRTA